jgi:hypothetical protein
MGRIFVARSLGSPRKFLKIEKREVGVIGRSARWFFVFDGQQAA